MNQLTREQKRPQVAVAGMWAGLWTREIILTAEYWLVRSASFALDTARAWLRHPFIYAGAGLFAACAAYTSTVVFHNVDAAQLQNARLDERALMNGVDLYKLETGHLPLRLEAMVPKYIRELRSDPWGKPYAYYQGEGGAAVVSAGPDGKLGTGDDIVAGNERGIK
jgi:hypothetical protein